MKVVLFTLLVAACILGSNAAAVACTCPDVCAIRCPDGVMCVLTPCELKARKELFNERWYTIGNPSVCPSTCNSEKCACIKNMKKNSACNCPWPKTSNPCNWLKNQIKKAKTTKAPCATTTKASCTTTTKPTCATTTKPPCTTTTKPPCTTTTKPPCATTTKASCTTTTKPPCATTTKASCTTTTKPPCTTTTKPPCATTTKKPTTTTTKKTVPCGPTCTTPPRPCGCH